MTFSGLDTCVNASLSSSVLASLFGALALEVISCMIVGTKMPYIGADQLRDRIRMMGIDGWE
jgi:hypothetical protein